MLGRKQSLRQTVTSGLATTAANIMGTGPPVVIGNLGVNVGPGGGSSSQGNTTSGPGGGIGMIQDGPSSGVGGIIGGLGGLGMAGELEECIRARTLWWESQLVRRFMRFCALLSLVSVSMNTPYTFSQMPSLLYITFVIDILVTFAFSIEFISKVRIRGARTYFHDRWSQFDITMLICLICSLILHIFEITGYVEEFSPLSMIRAPRPLIMVRVVRVFLSFSMPRARITQIFLRSSQQIYNVTLFFVFFMSLFGLLGVQFFSSLNHHCVLIDNYTEFFQPSIHMLAIPDTYCSPEDSHGHQCPPEMVCVEIHNSSGYAGFDNLAHALFTVYQSASQEGWSHVMYQAMDSLDFFRSAIYFVTLIFFLAWLVKNVFIAVITETFNEIRVQFQQMWGERAQIVTQTIQLVLVGDDKWKLVQLTDSDARTRAPHLIRHLLGTASFQIFVMVMIVVNAIINASIKFDHSGKSRDDYYRTIYPSEVFFTIFFDIEVMAKIWCYGLRTYVRRSLHKLELLLAIGSSIHVLPPLYMTSPLVYFQVLRIVRLIKASPVLEDFVYKIFGPGKKLGSLIIFTMCLLIVTSSISMQLFCCFPGYNKFQSFPEAFMSMFQILTQEGWTEVMNETILRSGAKIGPLVAIYFILYHLFVSLIVLSLFVAVILDNLELDEDIKKVKQLKAREQSAGYNEELPLRLRLFESFPDSPQMTRLHKQANEFNIPKVRDSFMRAFIDSTNATSTVISATAVPSGAGTVTATVTSTITGTGLPAAATATAAQGVGGGGGAINRPMIMTAAGNLTASNKPMLPSLCSSGGTSIGGLFFSTRKQSSIKLLSPVSKGRHSSPLLRRVQVACIVSDSNNQRLLLNDTSVVGIPVVSGGVASGGAGTTTATTSGGGGGFTRHGVGSHGVSSRGMRRSVRGNLKEEVGTEESHSGTGNGPLVRGQDFDFKMLQRKQKQAEMRRTQRESDLRENHPFFDTPLLIVGRESRFRMICQSIVSAKYDPHVRDPVTGKERKMRYKGAHELLGLVPYCDWIMIIVTTVSCASMMCETGEHRITNTPILVIAEYTFVFAMAIELLLKTLAYGLLFTPNAYLANVAGVMDFLIFGISVLFLCLLPEQVPPQSWQQTLYVMRCIRPLRIFSLVPHMRKVVYELCRGVKEIALVSVLLIVLLFVFASVGVHMFGGLLARCNDPCIKTREQCVGVFMRQVHVTRMKLANQNEKMPSILVPRVWANPRRFNFDSLGNGILALFEVLSFKGWLDIRDVILARLTPLHAIYIHVFVFLGCMIGLTLFVGVVIANYGENKGTALLTVDQRRWCDLKKRLKIAQPLHLPPRPDHHRARAIIYDITQHIIFKRTIAILVLINSALLCVSWDINMEHTKPLANVSAALTCVFVFEVFMKMIAFTPRGYWQSRRNRYDLFVTVLGVLWLILHFTFSNKASNAFGFIVVILRFFTITGKHATLKMLMLTVAVSVYKSFFIIMGLFLLILCYALTGVILFGSVKFGENISRHANFRTAITGVITLFRIVTGEDWNKIMHDAMLSPPFCTPSGDNFWTTDCGNYYASLAFFCSFYVCITYIVLNLLVAIIMENFSLFYSNEEDALLSYADIRNFQNTWNLVDIQQRGMIPVSRVKFVLRLLKGRLEVDPNKDRLLFKHMCHEMERLHNGEDVTFHDVLNMLSYRSVDIRKSLQLEELLAREELEFLIEEEVAKQTIRAWLDQCLRRIKKERQQQSLIHSLRATNEPSMGQSSFFGLGTTVTDLNNDPYGLGGDQMQLKPLAEQLAHQQQQDALAQANQTDDEQTKRDDAAYQRLMIKSRYGDVKIPSFGPKFPMDNTADASKSLWDPDEFGGSSGTKRPHGSAHKADVVAAHPPTPHPQPHQHKRVEFRHVEERSKQQQNPSPSTSGQATMITSPVNKTLLTAHDSLNIDKDLESVHPIISPTTPTTGSTSIQSTTITTTTATKLASTLAKGKQIEKLKIPSSDPNETDIHHHPHTHQHSGLLKTAMHQRSIKQVKLPPASPSDGDHHHHRPDNSLQHGKDGTPKHQSTTSSQQQQQMPVRRFLSLHSYPPTSLSGDQSAQQHQKPIKQVNIVIPATTSTTKQQSLPSSQHQQLQSLDEESSIGNNGKIITDQESGHLIDNDDDEAHDDGDSDDDDDNDGSNGKQRRKSKTQIITDLQQPSVGPSSMTSTTNTVTMATSGGLPLSSYSTTATKTTKTTDQFRMDSDSIESNTESTSLNIQKSNVNIQQQQHSSLKTTQQPSSVVTKMNGTNKIRSSSSSSSGTTMIPVTTSSSSSTTTTSVQQPSSLPPPPPQANNNKKINQVRAQILVNEVHDWWLLHLN
uniref:Sodium leak channel non-selective protein-like isoform X2 n=1 Tax=Dermatophagoides pteronyssinus TaxID=6956 RepID=A0A6P6XQM5_DERPT|nr:sodium leak channel non-selective protein-like isoform X2 [Dermatophagoides pteronyssinus]